MSWHWRSWVTTHLASFDELDVVAPYFTIVFVLSDVVECKFIGPTDYFAIAGRCFHVSVDFNVISIAVILWLHSLWTWHKWDRTSKDQLRVKFSGISWTIILQTSYRVGIYFEQSFIGLFDLLKIAIIFSKCRWGDLWWWWHMRQFGQQCIMLLVQWKGTDDASGGVRLQRVVRVTSLLMGGCKSNTGQGLQVLEQSWD